MLRVWILALVASVAGAQEAENLFSKEKEAVIGAMMAKEVLRGLTPLDSQAAQEYVERLGSRLAAQLPAEDLRFTFAVVRDSATLRSHTQEPASLLGGHIFVRTGLFLAARNEAEFAGMIAHAMAHVAERHSTRMVTRGKIENLSRIPLVFSFGGSDEASLVPLGYLAFARQSELEADQLAVRMLAGAGYDPAALTRYIERTQPPDTEWRSKYSPLPDRETRIAAMERAIGQLPAKTYQASDEFLRLQEQVRDLTGVKVRVPPSLRR